MRTDLKFRQWAGALVVLALSWAWGLRESWSQFPARGTDAEMGDYVDQLLLLSGLAKAHTLRDTLAWWTGSWAGGETRAFYRPLPSLIWWFQLQLFGRNGAQGFMAVHFASHFVACVLLFAFLWRVLGGRVALLSVAIWASGALAWMTLPVPAPALLWWKDSVDVWLASALVLCLWSLLSFWRTGQKRFFAFAVGAQLLAIAVKEMSYITPFLAGLLLWHEWDGERALSRSAQVRSVAVLPGIVAVAFVFRLWALHGMGFRFGTNGSWFYRFCSYCIGGRPASLFSLGDVAPVGVALVLIAALIWRRSGWRRMWPCALAGIVLVLWNDWKSGEAFNTLYRLLSLLPLWAASFYADVLVALAVIGFWWQFGRVRDRIQLFGYGWLLLAYLPLLSASIMGHALYIPSIGWAICAGKLLSEAIEYSAMVARTRLMTRPGVALTSQP